MTAYLTTRKNAKLELNGNLLTGDTYEIKGYIKSYLDGRWNAEYKGWTVNVEKITALAIGANSIGLKFVDAPAEVASKHSNIWRNADGSLAEDY